MTKIWTNPEQSLEGLKGQVSVPTTLTLSKLDRQHVAEAEVEIRILKERLRSYESGLSF